MHTSAFRRRSASRVGCRPVPRGWNRNRFGLLLCLLAWWSSGGPAVQAQQTVTNASLSALRAALAAGGGTITLAFNGSISVTTPLQISYDTILDASTNTVSLLGAGTNSVIIVPAGINFAMSNVTVSGGTFIARAGTAGTAGENKTNIGGNGGNASDGGIARGGALQNAGTTRLVNCSFLTNSATGAVGGAGGAGGSGASIGGNGGNGGNGGSAHGGAIYNSGVLLLTNCTFAGNSLLAGAGGAPGTAGSGASSSNPGAGGAGGSVAGAAVYNATNGVLNIVNCVFYQNSATGGTSATAGVGGSGNTGLPGATGGGASGGAVASDGQSTVVNTTFYGNSAIGGTGGMGGSGFVFSGNGGSGGNAYGGGFSSTGSGALTNCTFSTCAATGGTNGISGGRTAVDGSLGLSRGDNLACVAGTLLLKNSLFAAGVNGHNVYGSFTDQGNNLSSDATPGFTRPTSRQLLDPQLDVLNANGGPTLTMALLRGSPAIDAAENLSFPLFDQRGSLRPTLTYSNYADIGAFEFGVNYLVAGFVSLGGLGLSGIPVSATNSSGQVFSTVTTNGDYSFNLLPGTFTVGPQPVGSFTPASRAVSVFTNVVNVNFALANAGPATIARAAKPASPSSLVLSFATVPNQVYRIQTSTNLVNWTGVLTNTATGSGPVYFTNTIATNIPYRFVRLVSP